MQNKDKIGLAVQKDLIGVVRKHAEKCSTHAEEFHVYKQLILYGLSSMRVIWPVVSERLEELGEPTCDGDWAEWIEPHLINMLRSIEEVNWTDLQETYDEGGRIPVWVDVDGSYQYEEPPSPEDTSNN